MAKMRDAKVLSTELIGNKFKKVIKEQIELPDGLTFDWIYLDSPKSIVVVALTPEKELVLVKLYRHNLKIDAYELPAGGHENDGETTLEAAKRELREETGYSAEKFIELGAYYTLPSETNRWVHYYLALDAVQTEQPQLDTLIEKYFDMSIKTVPFTPAAIDKLVKNKEMASIESLFGIRLAQAYLSTTDPA